ncbi:MAG TPA: carbohydrate ABC transporter permease [Acidimicrobiales bacterium]|nr:carbohydrate ABC transporter permease [Acidimicrobiales bacterium]
MSAIALDPPVSKHGTPGRRALVRTWTIGKLTVFYGILIGVGAIFMVPYILALFGSLKPESQLLTVPPWDPPTHPAWANYPDTWSNFSQVQTDFAQYFLNTAIVTVCLTIGQVFFSMLAAYAFARLKFPGREGLFWIYLMTLMVPNIVTIIPLYTVMDKLHLVNTYWAVFLPYALGTPYTIFLMRQFFRGIPQEVVDAARIDGCGDLGVLRRIIVPLSRPVLITAALIAFVFSWNNFLWPLVITNTQSHYLLTVALANFNTGPGTGEYLNIALTGSLITLIPMVIVFIVFNRYIIRSIQLTSGK